ncbi:hypothetical protein T4A_13648, partial [Trichinella pseudospiralis]
LVHARKYLAIPVIQNTLQDYSAATFYIKHPRSHFSTIADLRDGRSWHEVIGSLTAQSCILRVCCAKEVHNHKRDYANFLTAKGIA